MAITREVFEAREKELNAERELQKRGARPINESLLKQAAVASTLLVQHPAWDVYLQRLQVLLDEAKANLTHWREKVAGAYGDADLRMVQIQVNVFYDRVQILTHCMTLPTEILGHAAETLDKPVE